MSKSTLIVAIFAAVFAMVTAEAQDSLFVPAVNYPVGTDPYQVNGGDLDGDGDIDLVTPNTGANTLSILFNNGDGTFQDTVNYPVPSRPRACFITDLDGDNDPDLAIPCDFTHQIAILKNNGDGTFQPSVNYNVGTYPADLYAIDLDSDNDADLAICNASGSLSEIYIMMNNGDGTFQAPVNYACSPSPIAVFGADFDHDSDNDLAVVNYNSPYNLSIYNNNGDGTFQTPVTYNIGYSPLDLYGADFDGDSYCDLVVPRAAAGNLYVYMNNGDGSFQAPVAYVAGSLPGAVYASDMNNDGAIDIAVGNAQSNDISILLNNGDGTFQLNLSYPAGNRPDAVYAADLDGDLDSDIATSNILSDNVSILRNIWYFIREFHSISPADNAIANGEVVWSPATNPVLGYPVFYKVYWDDNELFGSPDSSSELSDTTFTLPEYVTRSQTYYWYVLAYDNYTTPRRSEETWSFYLNGYPYSPAPFAPLNGADADSNTVFSWYVGTDPDSFDAVSYTIQMDDDSLFASPEIDQSGLSNTLLDEAFAIQLGDFEDYENLQMDTRYYWRVRSDDGFGLSSDWPDSLLYFTYMRQNHPPNPPVSGFSPADYEEVISLNPTITWNNATDPDPDDNPGTLHYIFWLFSDTSTGCGFEYWDTTAVGINQVTVTGTMPDNCLWIYFVKTVDDEGLESDWSAMQHFWTNHYNYPPEPFVLDAPDPDDIRVVRYTGFVWGSTVDYDPLSSFTFTLEYSPDSLFGDNVSSIEGLSDTTLTLATDSLMLAGQDLYWRVLAIDDNGLVRMGGIPEEFRYLRILPPGDGNCDGSTNGLDVVFLVGYFKSGPGPCIPLAGDANGSCSLNGLDVTFLVFYFKGGPAPVRADCEQ